MIKGHKRHYQHMKKMLGLMVITLGMLSGCAYIPDLGALSAPRADLASGERDSTILATEFPQEKWWEGYQDPQLSSLIEHALTTSPSTAEAQARILKAEGVSQQAGASAWPSVSGDANYTKLKQSYNNGVPSNFVPHGFQDTAKASLNFSYEFDFWGKNKNTLAAALSDQLAISFDAAQADLILSTAVADHYATLSRLYAELDTAKQSLDVRHQSTSLFKQRFDKELENESVVEQARANEASAAANVETIKENIDLTKNMLAYLVGEKPDYVAQINRPTLKANETLSIPKILPADLIARRPDISAMRMNVESAARRIDVAKAGFYPNIDLTASIGQQSMGLDNFFKHGSFIGAFGPALHLPIFEGGALQGQYRGARADYDLAVAQYDDTILQALHEVADAQVSRNALIPRTKNTERALKASEKAYRVINNRYKAGLATYLEVLQAENTMLDARQEMTLVHARRLSLDVALIKALGGGFTSKDKT